MARSPKAFFYWDEWSLLRSLAYGEILNWLIQPHLGHLLIAGKLIYFAELSIFADNHLYYQMVSAIIHSLSSGLLFLILFSLSKHQVVAFCGAFIYGIYFPHVQSLMWAMQVMLISMIFMLFLSMFFLLRFMRSRNRFDIGVSALTSYLSSLFFGIGLVSGALNILLAVGLCDSLKDLRLRQAVLFHSIATLMAVVSFFVLGGIADQSSNHPGAIGLTDRTALFEAFLNGDFYIFLLSGVFGQPVYFLSGGFIPQERCLLFGVVSFLIVVGIGLVLSETRKRFLVLAVVYLASLATLMILPALGRFQFGPEEAFALRYSTFAVIPAVFVLCLLTVSVLARGGVIAKFVLPLFLVFCLSHSVTSIKNGRNLRDEWGRVLLRVRENYYDFKVRLEDNSLKAADGQVFLPEANPQLTRGELREIINKLFDPVLSKRNKRVRPI